MSRRVRHSHEIKARAELYRLMAECQSEAAFSTLLAKDDELASRMGVPRMAVRTVEEFRKGVLQGPTMGKDSDSRAQLEKVAERLTVRAEELKPALDWLAKR